MDGSRTRQPQGWPDAAEPALVTSTTGSPQREQAGNGESAESILASMEAVRLESLDDLGG